jgi:hypothetical protein
LTGPAFLEAESRRLFDGYRADPSAGEPELRAFAAVLDEEYGRDPDVDALLVGSFLALLPPEGTEPDPAVLVGERLGSLLDGRGWRAAPEDRELVRRLVAAVPPLERLAQENGYGDHDEPLTLLFLADVQRLLVENLELGRRLDDVRTVLDLLEAELGSGHGVEDTIAVGFVESLPYADEPGAALLGLLGPKLRAELVAQRGEGAFTPPEPVPERPSPSPSPRRGSHRSDGAGRMARRGRRPGRSS